jgi:hypothetical protein
MAASLITVIREKAKYKPDLVEELKSHRDGTEIGSNYIFFCGKRKENYEIRTGSFCA